MEDQEAYLGLYLELEAYLVLYLEQEDMLLPKLLNMELRAQVKVPEDWEEP